MITPSLPEDEVERLAALHAYDVLDTEAEALFDDLTRVASMVCETPIALVSLVDEHRQWFKSRHGLEATETPRDLAFCAHAILRGDEVLEVADSTLDERFHDNPLVTGEPRVRFYAGAPLVTPEGHAVGTLCVIGHEPKQLAPYQLDTLQALSRQVVSQLELRRANTDLLDFGRRLADANNELRQFTSVAAHDLQEPLRGLISFSDLLREDLGRDLPPRAEEDLDFICSAARRMRSLVTDLLQLSRTGFKELEPEELTLTDCVDSALEALSTRIEETGATVRVAPLPSLRGDRTLLTQLFQNLIGNALKFVADRTPEVDVTCTTEDGAVVIGVKDNGIGMDPAFAEQVFVPFKRLHGRAPYEGTGIGLSIAQKAADRHGGRIWVEAIEGQGCHFRFVLGGITPARAAIAA